MLALWSFVCLSSCATKPADEPREIFIGVPFEIATLDPHVENSLSNFAVLSNVYEGLVRMDADLGIQPQLASSWENPDRLTWIFRLETGVRFHSGKEFSSADVVYTLRRIVADPSLRVRTYLSHIEEIRAVDSLTVKIRTSRSLPALLGSLSHVLIVPDGATGNDLENEPDGTGPYLVANWDKHRRVRLAHDGQHRGGSPLVVAATFELGIPSAARLAGLIEDRYQLIQLGSIQEEAEVHTSARHRILDRESLYVRYLGFNLASEIDPSTGAANAFRDARVRRAVHLGLDRDLLTSQLAMRAIPASQPFTRAVFGFSPALGVQSFEPDRARALLTDAGYPSGLQVTLHTRKIFRRSAEAVRMQLARIGIEIELRALADADFLELVSARESAFWLSRWGCVTGEASEFLEAYVKSDGSNNYGGIADPDFDRSIARIADLQSAVERRDAFADLVAELIGDVILVPLFEDRHVFALECSYRWQPRIDGYIRLEEIRAGSCS